MTKQDLFNLYSTDSKFIENYHGNVGWTIDICVEDSWEKLNGHELYLYEFGYFSVDRYGDLIPKLGGFFIKPEFRNNEIKQLLYREICSKMPNIFLSSLNNKSPGIKFLSNFPGCEIITKTDDYTYFCFRQENK